MNTNTHTHTYVYMHGHTHMYAAYMNTHTFVHMYGRTLRLILTHNVSDIFPLPTRDPLPPMRSTVKGAV